MLHPGILRGKHCTCRSAITGINCFAEVGFAMRSSARKYWGWLAALVLSGSWSLAEQAMPRDADPVLSILPESTNLSSEAASEQVIQVTANVAWTAATNVPWLSITFGGAGTTNGTVVYAAAANGDVASRTGAIIVAGGGLSRTCMVVQAGFVPALSLQPPGTNLPREAASELVVGVTANISWTAATNAPWLAITSGHSGTTNGTVVFAVAANEDPAARTGAIIVTGGGLTRTCTVLQAGIPPVLEMAPLGTNLPAAGASGRILDVTANIPWTATTNRAWLSITSGESGTTNGTLTFDAASNTYAIIRTGAVIVTGVGLARTCVVVQAAGGLTPTNWYVATNGSDSADGTTWLTAKQTIQAGVDAAVSGDTVWVSNGVYAAGGRVASGTWTNRVAIDKPLTVRSANGPETTFIVGAGWRCAYVTNGAVLAGFTLTNGATAVAMGLFDTNMDHDGGGALCESSGVLTNCILADNWASDGGGGASGGILNNCTLSGNYSWNLGGGAEGGTLNRCMLSGNRADMWGGGAYNSTLNECTLIGNRGASGGGAYDSTLSDCVLTTNWASDSGGGAQGGTLTRCVLESNRCAGSVGGGGADSAVLYNSLLAGNQAMPSSSLLDEPRGGGTRNSTLINCTVVNNTAIWGGGVSGGTAINTVIFGNTATNNPNWIDGEYAACCTIPAPSGSGNLTNDPLFVAAAAGNYHLQAASPCIEAGDNSAAPGATDLAGKPRIVFRRVDLGAYEFPAQTWYVATNGSDAADGTSWANAKQTPQAAVDAAAAGDLVWVSNGVYATGGRVVEGALTNRVALLQGMAMRSVNGPEVTTIQGTWDPDSTNGIGDAAARCAYVANGAVLTGFTLTNGATQVIAPTSPTPFAVASEKDSGGGGARCMGNGTMDRCILTGNASDFGGGVYGGILYNCLLYGNYATMGGGGAMESLTINCTFMSNSAGLGNDILMCGGANCIANADPDEIQFMDAAAGNYRLKPTSPCIDAGDSSVVFGEEDLDGNQRIVYGAVDIGAYEAQLAGAGTWFGAITNGLTNDADCVAGDGVPNLLKYATGGSPRIADDMMLLTMPAGGMPPLEFNRNPNATDIRIIVEEADAISNGAAWRGIATNLNGSWGGAANVSESGTGNPVVCTVTDPAALVSNRFLRLRVSRP